MATRTTITRTALLKWNERWTDRERSTLEAMVDQFGGVTFTEVVSGWDRHVAVHDADGRLILDVAAGRVYMKAAQRWPGSVPYDPEHDTDEDHHIYLLDTRGQGSKAGAAADPTGGHPMCMDCFQHHPSGGCVYDD